MALFVLEGFEGPLLSGGGWSDITITYGPGRSGKCAQLTSSSSRIEWNGVAFPAATVTVTMGAAFRVPAAPAAAGALFSLNGTSPNTIQTSCCLNPNMTISVNKGNVGTSLGVGSYTVQVNEWIYLEWQVTLGTAAPTKLRINNTTVLDLASVNTQPAANIAPAYASPTIGASALNNIVFFVDDLYVNLGTEFLGDIVVEELTPNGNGSVSQFNGSDGDQINNYLLVADTSTSTHTRDSIIGHQDLYQLSNLATTAGDIAGVCHLASVQKSDSGAAQFRLLNHGAADTKSAIVVPTTTAIGYTYGLLLNPETGLPFTIAEVNALQTGIEVA
jgi:hypothetical protein